jgi:CRP-like cAMP-binding protein
MIAADWSALEAVQPTLASIPLSLREQAAALRVAGGSLLAGLGSRPQSMYFIHSGELRLRRLSMNGTEIVLQRASSGFIAEASLESQAYHCDVVAAQESYLVVFPIRPFVAQLRIDTSFAQFWMSMLAREVRALRAQCERLALRSARERIQHYIESEGNDGRLELRQTRKAWASELGLTHEALYRTLSAMAAEGVVRLEIPASGVLRLVACTKPGRRD